MIGDEAAKDVANGKGTKDDHNKTDITLLDPDFLDITAQVMMQGAKKYKRGNWKLNLEPIRILSALLRHAFHLWRGEWIDKESGLPHTAHISCNAMFLDYYRRQGAKIET